MTDISQLRKSWEQGEWNGDAFRQTNQTPDGLISQLFDEIEALKNGGLNLEAFAQKQFDAVFAQNERLRAALIEARAILLKDFPETWDFMFSDLSDDAPLSWQARRIIDEALK